jgi:hypothetical protein
MHLLGATHVLPFTKCCRTMIASSVKEYRMRVIYLGTKAAYNDTFAVDAVASDGECVRAIVYCRNLQAVPDYLKMENLAAVKIS